MTTKSRATLLGLLVGGLLIAQSARADLFKVEAWAPAGYGAVNVANSAPATSYNYRGGGFRMTNTSANPNTNAPYFISWCVDLYEHISSTPSPYTEYIGGNNISQPWRDDLNRLATMHLVAATASGAGDSAAAFQLAVWEIFYERTQVRPGDITPYSLSDGNFTAIAGGTSAATYTPYQLAQTWLGEVNNPLNNAMNYTLNAYTSTGNPGRQDQITFVKKPGFGGGDCGDNCNVPEPATLSLLGIGLMGLGYIRRKSARAVRT